MKVRDETVNEFNRLYELLSIGPDSSEAHSMQTAALLMIADELAKMNERTEADRVAVGPDSDEFISIAKKFIHIADEDLKCPQCGCDDDRFSMDEPAPQDHLFSDSFGECENCGWTGSLQEVADAVEKRKSD